MENIPESIIELIEQYSFEELSETQQQLVLNHLSASAYNSLHDTYHLLSQQHMDLPPENLVQKNKLMDRFVAEKQTVRPLWSTPVQFWKAASIFILLGAGWLIHWQTYKHKHVEYVTQLDTVYLDKEVPVKVYDTVYYKEENEQTFASHNRTKVPAERNHLRKQEGQSWEDYIEPVRRGTSAKDDSLIQSFKFVTL